MAGAIEVYKLAEKHPCGSRHKYPFKTVPYIMNVFLDGLIAFHAARTIPSETEEWLAIGLESMILLRR